ncbi:uncharacterized protein RSE6_03166 [Rhynchosporium secalis]|uniref:Uncharacterized protein n=1 Tax=Rhynchosporium secalis TaxID=38038 RepID=A0A1E1M227_RHYSE|nr:uncharacterized protein RSE6_03166 [Rhynchosporium secalis]
MEHTWNDRSISIFTSEESPLIGTTSQKLIDRILDAGDSLSTHVNDLTIKDWKPEKDGTDVLCNILNNLKVHLSTKLETNTSDSVIVKVIS